MTTALISLMPIFFVFPTHYVHFVAVFFSRHECHVDVFLMHRGTHAQAEESGRVLAA